MRDTENIASLKRDMAGYLEEYEHLLQRLGIMRDAPYFVVAPDELDLVASDPYEVIRSAERQLARMHQAIHTALEMLRESEDLFLSSGQLTAIGRVLSEAVMVTHR